MHVRDMCTVVRNGAKITANGNSTRAAGNNASTMRIMTGIMIDTVSTTALLARQKKETADQTAPATISVGRGKYLYRGPLAGYAMQCLYLSCRRQFAARHARLPVSYQKPQQKTAPSFPAFISLHFPLFKCRHIRSNPGRYSLKARRDARPDLTTLSIVDTVCSMFTAHFSSSAPSHVGSPLLLTLLPLLLA